MSVERVGIYVEVRGADAALDQLRALDKIISRLNRKKIRIDLGNAGELKGLVNVTGQTQKYTNEVKKAQAQTKSFGDAMRTTFNRISSVTMHTGQQMQVLGKTLTQISSPMRTLFRSTVWAGGFKVLNQVTEGMSNGFERADIMRKYPRVMKAMGYSSDEAAKSVQRLEQAVLGLPTGLDEMVTMSQRFTSTTGSLQRGTDLAIAANNAFLASMSTEVQRYQGMMQLQDVIGGKDMNAREWMALANSMMPAIRMMGESLGKTGQELDDYVAAVQSGQIANEDFIKTLIDAGSAADGKIRKVAEESMDTWEAFFSRIRTASSNLMFKGIIEPLNELVNTVTGGKFESVNLFLDDFIYNGIGNLRNALADWIRANPDYILDFFRSLKQFDWGGLVRGVGEGLKQTMDDIKQFVEFFGGTGISGEAMGRFFARAPLYGKILNVAGGFLKGMRGIIATIGTAFAIPSLMAKTKTGGGIFGLFGSLLGKDISIAEVQKIRRAATALPTVTQSMRGVVSSLTRFMKLGGAIAIISGTGFVAFKAFKSMMKDLQEMTDIASDIDWNVGKEVLYHMAGFFGSFAVLSGILAGLPEVGGAILGGELVLGAIVTLASGILALNMRLVKSAFRSFRDVTKSIAESIETLSSIKATNIPKNTIQDAVTSLGDVYNMLRPQYQGQGIQNMSTYQANRMKDNIKAMGDVLKNIVGFQETIGEINRMGVIPSSVTEKIQNIFEQLGNIHTAISGSFATKAHVSQAEDAAKILDSTKKMFDNLIGEGGIIAQIGKISGSISSVAGSAANIGRGRTPLDEARSGLGRLFAGLSLIYQDLSDFEIHGGTTNRTKNAATTIGNVKKMFENLIGENGVVGLMHKVGSELPKLVGSQIGRGRTPIDNVRDMLKRMFGALGDIYESITDSKEGLGMYQTVTKGSSGTANEILTNVKEMFANLVGEGGIISQLMNLSGSLPNLVGSAENAGRGRTPIDNVKDMLKRLFGSINDIFTFLQDETELDTDMGSLSETIGLLPQIMTDIQTAVNTISGMSANMKSLAGEEGTFPIVQQIKNMISQLTSAFSSESIMALQIQVATFKATVANLVQSIADMIGMSAGNPLEVQITLTHTVSGADEIVAELKKIESNIDSAWDAIPDSLSKEIPITITYRKNVQRFPSLGVPSGLSTGGMAIGNGRVLYRAKGGDTLFKPRGTDTVPAMLTPGEYVHRKKAVDFFGIDFMRKVNHLDVRGVIESLMSRASGASGFGRQTIVNNTYNNNSNVTINNASAGAGFTFKSASRFAGAF